jgi:hypothetical protein
MTSRLHRLVRGRTLNPLFDRDWYLQQYPDVKESEIDPYHHYLRHGAREGRNPNPRFDTDWYLSQNPDVRESGLNPLVHFFYHGAAEGRDPHPLFFQIVSILKNILCLDRKARRKQTIILLTRACPD